MRSGGLWSGHRAMAFGVGPLRLERQSDRWRFRWAQGVQGIGGFALLFPKEGEATRGQSTAYLLGGPLSNLLVAAVALPFAMPGGGDSVDMGHVIARIVVGTGLLIGVINLIPFLAGGWSSDGRQLLKLWQGAEEARAVAFLTRLGGLSLAGVRPRDWPMVGVDGIDLGQLPQGIAEAFARCRIAKAMDDERFDDPEAAAAATALAEGFWRGPDGMRQINALLLARWVLESRGDPELAEQWLTESNGGLLDQSAPRAAMAAWIALHRGDRTEATVRLQEARSLRSRVHDAASLAMFDEDIAKIDRRLAEA